MIKYRLSWVALLAPLSACVSSLAQQDLPAVIDKPTAAGRSELTQAVSSFLHGASVTLSDDALTGDSVLIVEKNHLRDTQGLQLSGRDLDKPERFQLLKSGKHCVLVHERTGNRQTLASVSCRHPI